MYSKIDLFVSTMFFSWGGGGEGVEDESFFKSGQKGFDPC